jgi:hypothetical protein
MNTICRRAESRRNARYWVKLISGLYAWSVFLTPKLPPDNMPEAFLISKLFNWKNKVKNKAFLFSLFFGAIHFVFSWIVILFIYIQAGHLPADWTWIWLLFWVIDFPISDIYLNITDNLSDHIVSFLPYPIDHIKMFILPALFHGIIGPIWYFFLSLFIIKFFKFIIDFFGVKK